MLEVIPKADLRNEGLKRRDRVGQDVRAKLAQTLAVEGENLALAFAAALRRPIASIYSPIGSEPDPGPLVGSLIDASIGLALPVDWSSGRELVYRRWAPGDRLAAGPLGIGEPLEQAQSCEPDILFLPVAAFDRRGFRLGYGAGNVDRTLTSLRDRKAIRVIGVAFSAQEIPGVPVESHDEPLDFIITETETITCSL